MPDRLLELSGIRRQVARALDDVTPDVMAGERVGLVGQTGSGKSTVARAVSRDPQMVVSPCPYGHLRRGHERARPSVQAQIVNLLHELQEHSGREPPLRARARGPETARALDGMLGHLVVRDQFGAGGISGHVLVDQPATLVAVPTWPSGVAEALGTLASTRGCSSPRRGSAPASSSAAARRRSPRRGPTRTVRSSRRVAPAATGASRRAAARPLPQRLARRHRRTRVPTLVIASAASMAGRGVRWIAEPIPGLRDLHGRREREPLHVLGEPWSSTSWCSSSWRNGGASAIGGSWRVAARALSFSRGSSGLPKLR